MDCFSTAKHPEIFVCDSGAAVFKSNALAAPYAILNPDRTELVQCVPPHINTPVTKQNTYTCFGVASPTHPSGIPDFHVYTATTNTAGTKLTLNGNESVTMYLRANKAENRPPEGRQ